MQFLRKILNYQLNYFVFNVLETCSTSQQNSLRRFFENLVLGDARRRGETHQCMYGRFNLKAKLNNIGFKEIYVHNYNASLIPNWNEFGLNVDEKGNQHKPESLYVEALK